MASVTLAPKTSYTPAVSITPSQARLALVGLRGALGVGWLAPKLLATTFGLGNPTLEPTLPYLVRLFCARDAALAFLAARTSGEAQRLVLQTGVVVDSVDAVAGVIAGATRKAPMVAAGLATGTAVAAAALGVIALRD